MQHGTNANVRGPSVTNMPLLYDAVSRTVKFAPTSNEIPGIYTYEIFLFYGDEHQAKVAELCLTVLPSNEDDTTVEEEEATITITDNSRSEAIFERAKLLT